MYEAGNSSGFSYLSFNSANMSGELAYAKGTILTSYVIRVQFSIVVLWSDSEMYAAPFHGRFLRYESIDLQRLSCHL
jgi:hypothetical protein